MVDIEHLWTPQDLRDYLRVSRSTLYRLKRLFPRVQGIPIERYDPATVKAIVHGETPAQKHRTVRAAAKREAKPKH